MKRTIHGLIVVLAAASAFGAAFAASASMSTSNGSADSIATQAMRAARVSLLSAAPGAGTAPIVTVRASDLSRGATSADLAKALYARVTVSGHAAAFAVDHAAALKGQLVLRVSGVPGADIPHLAPVSAVATDLFEASQGSQPVVLLARGQGPSAVTFALYDPAMGYAYGSMGVSGADRATVWVNGTVRDYPVAARGGAIGDLVIASGARQGTPLTSVVGGAVAEVPQANPSTVRAAAHGGQTAAVAATTEAMAPVHPNEDLGMHGDIVGYQTANGQEIE
ncbi:MAG: hypothetical protein P8Y02_02915 [Deinococcales bacterium]